MEHHVDALGREVVVENRRVVEFDRVVEILGRSEIEVVDRDDLVFFGEVVRQIRADEAGAASSEDSFAAHTSKLSPSDKNVSQNVVRFRQCSSVLQVGTVRITYSSNRVVNSDQRDSNGFLSGTQQPHMCLQPPLVAEQTPVRLAFEREDSVRRR